MLTRIAQKVSGLNTWRKTLGAAISFSGNLLLLPPKPDVDVVEIKSERNKFLESDIYLQQAALRLYKQANRTIPPDYDIGLARTYYQLAVLYFNYFNKPNPLGVDLDLQKLNTKVAACLNEAKRFNTNHLDKITEFKEEGSKQDSSLLFPPNSTLLKKALFLLEDADAMYDSLFHPPNSDHLLKLAPTSRDDYFREHRQIVDLLKKVKRIQVLPETEKLNEDALSCLAKQQPEQALAFLNKAISLDEKAQPKEFYSWNVVRDKVNLGLTYYQLYQSASLEDHKKAGDYLVKAYSALQSGIKVLLGKGYRSLRGIAVINNNLGVIYAQSIQAKGLEDAVNTFKHSLVLVNGLLVSPEEKPYDEEALQQLQQKIRVNLYYSLIKLRSKLDQQSSNKIDKLTVQIQELKDKIPQECLVASDTADSYKMLNLLEYW